MSQTLDRINEFVAYVGLLEGYERGEAQVFCDRLFKAFGHAGYKEAGASLEDRTKGKRKKKEASESGETNGTTKAKKGKKTTHYADLVWKPRMLMEMKSKGERLQKHFQQAADYWVQSVPHRPQYVVLCNFEEFWIYDFDLQMEEPVDRVKIEDLPDRYEAMNFMFPDNREPKFENNKFEITEKAARAVADVFRSLLTRGEDREVVQRFILQCIVAMFAEDFDLLRPKGLFTEIIDECLTGKRSTFDELGALFRQMNSEQRARKGRYVEVEYFNGGLFETVEPVELNQQELKWMREAATKNWKQVSPPIFGTIFQASMDEEKRHDIGAHFTHVSEIQKVIAPTIVRPWRDRIKAAETLTELLALNKELTEFKVLDPACGSGNFLYVAFRELVNLEMEILARIHDEFGAAARKRAGTASLVSATQFYGIDDDKFAVELAKVTLMLGKRITIQETHDSWFAARHDLPFEVEDPLPLDNLDANFQKGDALFVEWPDVNAIVGNPPYLYKGDLLSVKGRPYLDRLHKAYPGVSGNSDYCVYWFRKAHDELDDGERAGLVGTNSACQGYSREGGLDYIVDNGGTITEAVASQVWRGEAVVHVSIVNWVKGDHVGKKLLFRQHGDRLESPFEKKEVDFINPDLTSGVDVTGAVALECNKTAAACFQGQTHGHKGFLLTVPQAIDMRKDATSAPAIHPYLTGDNLLRKGKPSRYAIDLNHCGDLQAALRHKLAYKHVEAKVMPDVLKKAEKEKEKDDGENARQEHAKRWWRFWRGRAKMMNCIGQARRYIVCVRHTRRPIFEFIDPTIHPNDALQVFPFEDDYSFGVLQSGVHWAWFVARCSTLKRDYRYTSNTVFDSFPWPQNPTFKNVKAVAAASQALRECRRKLMAESGTHLRDIYRTLDVHGKNQLQEAHDTLTNAVRTAYGMGKRADILGFLLALNAEVAAREEKGEEVTGPGLPDKMATKRELFSDDRVAL